MERAADPFSGDEWLLDAGCFENYLRYGVERAVGPLEESAWRELDERFHETYREILLGIRPFGDRSLSELARHLGISDSISHDRRPATPGPTLDDAVLWERVEDMVPDIVPAAADRVLGPFADEAPPRPLLRMAVLLFAGIPTLRGGGTVAGRGMNCRPRPGRGFRSAMTAYLKAPAMLYGVRSDSWQPLLPLAQAWVPTGPVAAQIAPLPGGTSRVVVARAWPDPVGGWHAAACMGLPETPPLRPLLRRLHLELMRCRRRERRTTWEDLLRSRSEVLYRSVATWWHHAR